MKKIISWLKSKWAEFKNTEAYQSLLKMAAFIALCAWFLGIVGGIGYTSYLGKKAIAIGLGVVFAISWPQVVKLWKLLNK